MPLKQQLYQTAKNAVNVLPSWLLRLRPFRIYEIRLLESITNLEQKNLSQVKLKWVESTEELTCLNHLAARVNRQQWNTTTCRAVVAWQGSNPIGIAWINSDYFKEPDLGLSYQLKSDDAWLHSAHVLPEYQGRGIYQELLRFITQELYRENYQRILLGVTHGNESSQGAHAKIGAMKIGTVIALRSLGITSCYCCGEVFPNGLRLGKEIDLSINRTPFAD